MTTHKIDLLEAARELFDELHSSAVLTGEVSSISKRGVELWGHAKDPLTSGLSMDAFLGEGYFGKTGGHVLCFGAGGSGKAIALHLINKVDTADRPQKMIITNRSLGRLQKAQAMVESLETDIAFEFIQNNDPQVNDQIMERLPQGSLVINATGMGKDTPGSPVTDQGLFPRKRHCLGDQLSRRTGFLAAGHGAEGKPQPLCGRWLAVFPTWLDTGHRRGAAY